MKLAFATGFVCGALALLYWIARSMGTPASVRVEQEWRVPTEYDGTQWTRTA